jgi:tellurite resistance protein
VNALERYEADEDVLDILERNMPSAQSWARVALFDAIRAAAADHDYDDDEKRAIRRVAARLGIDDRIVTAREAVYLAEQELKQKRIGLVFGDEVPYQDRA